MVGGAPVTQEYADAVGARRLLGRRLVRGQEGERADPTAARKGARMSTGAVPAQTVLRSRSKTVTIGARPAVLRHRRANQPDWAQEVRRGAARRRAVDGDPRRGGAGRDRRGHARRQRRHPARRRGRAAEGDAADRAAGRRRADLHRLLGDRGARGRAVGVRGPGARELGHRRGRAARGDPAAGRAARRRRDRARQRRDRHPGDAGEAARVRAEDRRRSRPTTGSRATTS